MFRRIHVIICAVSFSNYQAFAAAIRQAGDVILTQAKLPSLRGKAVFVGQTKSDWRHATVGHRLPTCIGIHAGEILPGNIGAIDHFEDRIRR